MNKHRIATAFCVLLVWVAALARAEAPQLPGDLQWITNDSDPVFADPAAKRGGRFRSFMMSFPPTLRAVGPDSNSSFVGYLRANALGLVGRHPNTLNPIPELATHWAFGADGKTIYYKLDPAARWSDGMPVTADDYLFTLEFMRSPHIVAPFYNDYYTNIITDVFKFDDYTIAVRGANAKPPYEMLFDYSIAPTPRHFHKLDPNWVQNYNWQIEPNTGPYRISAVRKGKYIEFERIGNWWANDRKYFRHRFNVDYVRFKVIRDLNIAHNHFTKGEIDTYPLIMPRLWYKKAQGAAYDHGYIGKIIFYNDVPQPAQGMFLNEGDPLLADRDVRIGLAHAMNFDKVIRTVLRGDYERLQTQNEGYGDYSNRTIRARAFDLAQADAYLRKAGWSERGPDGIRIKGGQRLSLRVTYSTGEHTPRLAVLKEEARKAGVELTLQLLDGTAWYKQIMEKKHQIAWMSWSGGGIAPEYWQFYHSENANKPQTNNVTNMADPVMDEKIMAYRAATDMPTRIRLAHELEQMVHDSGDYIPGYKVPYTREAFWRWLKLPPTHGTRSTELVFDPFGGAGGLFWIDEDEKSRVQKARPTGAKMPPIFITDETWRTAGPTKSGGTQ